LAVISRAVNYAPRAVFFNLLPICVDFFRVKSQVRAMGRGVSGATVVMSRNKFIIYIGILGLLIAAGYGVWSTLEVGGELVLSGVVEADDIHVGSKVGGRVLKVAAKEGQGVKAGDVLVLLEPYELNASLAESRASLKQAEAKLAALVAGYRKEEIDQAKADWLAGKVQHENAERFRRRMGDLIERELISHQDYDDAKAKAEEAEQRMKSAKERHDLLLAGTRHEEVSQARASVEMARARVEILKTQLNETVIRAPVDAVVEVLDLEPGDLVGAGKPVATLLRTNDLWVRAYLPEKRLGYVQPGLKVKIRVDSFPQKNFSGTVRRVNRQAEFTPRNVQTTEERVLQVFQTEVVIEDPDRLLRPGMNADVFIKKSEK
ncbi:MAG: HlyD family efflux transporter periplasmic adaptor subunit, partial [Candidatus Binatota bacterium]